MEGLSEVKAWVWEHIADLKPSFMSKKPHFNFITAHYFWILSASILGSVLIFGAGRGVSKIAYIDALFFAAGANTQAGLNPVDVNLLNTFQQIVIMLLSMMSNPITINSFVVFLRLYWFEKRFQNIAREARLRRRTLSKSKSKGRANGGIRGDETGVNGRNITVMRDEARGRITNDGILLDPFHPQGHVNGKTEDDKDYDHEAGPDNEPAPNRDDSGARAGGQEGRRPEIKFADTVKRSDGLADDATKLPPQRANEDHIAILERQRNPDNDDVLHIPGPRDAERGILPTRLGVAAPTDHDARSWRRRRTSSMETPTERPQLRGIEGRQQAITIEEPERPIRNEFIDDAAAAAHTLYPFRLRVPRIFARDKRYHHEEDAIHVTSSKSRRQSALNSLKTVFSRDKNEEPAPYLSWEPTLGRNSAFLDLNEERREELGGIEYRSLKTLALILFFYFWGFWTLGAICLVPWIVRSAQYGPIVDGDGIARTWWGFFTSTSAFMDLGFTLTPDSLNSFNTAVFPLLIMSFLIVIGNTGFPVMLRFVIWISSNIVPRGTGLWEELKFLLDHPRRCFTLLFPSGATWWLFWLLVMLNGLDLIFFIVLDLGSGPIAQYPVGYRILDGLFQAFSTRTAGFSCVNLATLHPGVQTSYLIMMYISVFPIAISVRRTNVYEEKALGMYNTHDEDDQGEAKSLSYVGAHLRRQLSFDLWYIFIGLFILTISEGPKLQRGDFAVFAVLFEIVSAYGTVGMSLGYATGNASLSSQFSVVGKLVIIAMQIRGRHRGLPYGLDRAILLPSESLNQHEAEDAELRLARRNSAISSASPQRRRSISRHVRNRSFDRGNILTHLLHPGPAPPLQASSGVTYRRSYTEPRRDVEDNDFTNYEPRRVETHRVVRHHTNAQ